MSKWSRAKIKTDYKGRMWEVYNRDYRLKK